ncbi:MAG: NAD(P)H-hydrate epimerase [Clostridia bacterium]|nr:NAD(P)H-hydrate epimerase [Clostridia bacterium]
MKIENEQTETVVSVEQMRRSDAYTIAHLVPSKELMYRAAMGVYEAYTDWTGQRIAILCGGGNNGGDGYALAGILKRKGVDPDIFQVSEKLSEDGSYYCGIALELCVPIKAFTEATVLTDYDVIVDCLLGTGFQGTVRGLTRDAIITINQSSAYVISVDINSGMNGDTGEAELAVKSDLTVSIGSYKQGLFKGKAREYINRLVNVDIGIVLV